MAHNEVKSGATLPVGPSGGTDAASQALRIVHGSPKRILVADDEHLMATAVASSLGTLGYEVIGPAKDGSEAVEMAEREVPDMCLLDIRMPEKDGLTAASEVWSRFGIPAVLVSAFSNAEYLERAAETGVFGYLLKPVMMENLRVAIQIAWSRASDADLQRKRIEQLETTIANRRTVERAKWMVIEHSELSEAEAHSAMQRFARSARKKLPEVAAMILEGKVTVSAIVSSAR